MRRALRSCCVGLLGAGALAALLGAGPAGPVALKTTEFGRGPTLVLVHALGSGRMVWMPTAKKLLASHRVVMVDLPGHGESALPDPFSVQACVDALDLVLSKQKADSTVLVAHGFGGLIALHEVQAHPDRVKGLVVIDAAAKSPMKIPDQQQQFFFQMLESRYDDVLKMMMMGQGRDTAQGIELYSQAQSVPPATVKAYLRAAMNEDASGALKKMKPSFLFIGSARMWPDTTTWTGLAKRLGYDEAGPIAARRIKDSAALIMKDQPDSLAAVIHEFAARAIAAKK